MGKEKARSNSHAIVQNCWVVPDIEAGMRHWLDMGYGPFLTIDLDLPNTIYRGKPAPLNLSIAMTQAGDLMIELIQQRNSGPSAYRDAYAANEGGFHHVCWICDDYEAEKQALVQRGFALACEGSIPGLTYCYFDTRADLGCMVEIVPDVPLIRGMYQSVRNASIGWDGSNPIRSLKL